MKLQWINRGTMKNIFKRYFTSIENSISRRLLRTVLSIYFVLTFFVTSAHIVSEYYNTKDVVLDMLIASEQTFHDILAADLWNYDYEELSITAESMMRLPFITGIEVSVLEGGVIFSSKNQEVQAGPERSFGHEFELHHIEENKPHTIGQVKVYSDTAVVFKQLESGLYTLVINAIIKTIALIILVIVVFNRLLTRPLGRLAQHAESIDIESLEFKPITVADNAKDELGQLQVSMNRMMGKTVETIQKLDGLNKNLESRVAVRTQELRGMVSQLDKDQVALRREVESRKKANRHSLNHWLN